MKISVEALAHLLGMPEDCEVETAPENEEGLICLIVSHDSIPDFATEVTGIMRQQVFEHTSFGFGHFNVVA